MNEPGFWDHQETAKGIVAEMKTIKLALDPVEALLRDIEDVRAMYDLGHEANDADSLEEADRMLAELEKRGAKVEIESLLDGANDARNAFFTIQAGAGGTEAQDWSEMMLRMYLYFFERRGWDVSEVDRQYGEQAGIKNVTLYVKGRLHFRLSAGRGGCASAGSTQARSTRRGNGKPVSRRSP